MLLKKIKALVFVLVICVFLALILVPVLRGTRSGPHNVTNYVDGVPVDQPDENTLVLTVQYEGGGASYEIGQAPVISTDSNFTAPLRLQNSSGVNGSLVFWYDCENAAEVDKIYVKPPIFYQATDLSPISVPLEVGQVAKQRAGDAEWDWFSIRSTAVNALGDSTYQASVVLDAHAPSAPRTALLHIGDSEYGGTAALHFADSSWDSCEFLFTIPATDEAEAFSLLSTATFSVTGALLHAEPTNLRFSADNAEIILMRGES